MLKRNICLALAIVLCVALFAACGGGSTPAPAPAPTQAPAENPAEAPAAPAENPPPVDDTVYTINVNLTAAEPSSAGFIQIFNELEQESGGRLKFDIFFANSLMAIQDIPKGLQTGIAEISSMPTNNFTSQMPLNSRILQFPFMGLLDPKESVEILTQLQQEFPEMQKEYEALGITNLGNWTFPPYHLHFTSKDKEIRTPADVKGLKIMSNKVEIYDTLIAAGAAPVQMPPPEVYSSLEKNVIDGYINNYAFEMMFGLAELVNMHTEYGDYGAWIDFGCTVMNTQFLNSLPEDLQKLIKDKFAEKSYLLSEDQLRLNQTAIDIGVERDNVFIKMTDAELNEWKELALPAREKALEEMSQNNPTVRAIYERALELIEEKFG